LSESRAQSIRDQPNLGESKLDSPHLPLVAETVFTDGLQLGITLSRGCQSECSASAFERRRVMRQAQQQWYSQTRGLEGTSRDLYTDRQYFL
jgi:hypothetical protein